MSVCLCVCTCTPYSFAISSAASVLMRDASSCLILACSSLADSSSLASIPKLFKKLATTDFLVPVGGT